MQYVEDNSGTLCGKHTWFVPGRSASVAGADLEDPRRPHASVPGIAEEQGISETWISKDEIVEFRASFYESDSNIAVAEFRL